MLSGENTLRPTPLVRTHSIHILIIDQVALSTENRRHHNRPHQQQGVNLSKLWGRIHSVRDIENHITTKEPLEEIRAKVICCTELGKRYPDNFFRARGGDFPNNIPLKDMEYYLKLGRGIGAREG